jgi:uncharacterized membrane protein YhaH (DUF805 family)
MLRFFFRASGRIGRREYALGMGVIYALAAAMLAWLVNHDRLDDANLLLLALAGLPLTAAMLVLVAKRCHDLALPGSFVLLLAVPAIGLLWIIALGFIPGNAGPNLYGAPPRFSPD